MVLSVMVASVSQIILKISANKKHKSLKNEYLNPYVICGYSFSLLSSLITILAYKGISYSSGPIIESLGYLFIMILSFVILKEKISWNVIIGNFIIIAGIIIFYL